VIVLFHNWLDGRRRLKERTHFSQGYQWAKHALENEKQSVSALRAFAEGTFNHDPYTKAFDRGVNAACDEVDVPEELL
jgi:hypothetical protein